MSVDKALKMLLDERSNLQREINKLDKAITALNGTGITRPRAQGKRGQAKRTADLKRIISFVSAEPGTNVLLIAKGLDLSPSYVYDRVRELKASNTIRIEVQSHKVPGKIYAVKP